MKYLNANIVVTQGRIPKKLFVLEVAQSGKTSIKANSTSFLCSPVAKQLTVDSLLGQTWGNELMLHVREQSQWFTVNFGLLGFMLFFSH